MKNKLRILIFYLIIGLFYSNLCVAQKETNIWYFGNNVGIDFNYNPPKALNNSKMYFEEGGSVISDASGRLLLYSNGQLVYNKNHELLKNGGGLLGDLSSTNNVVIVPMPDVDSIYYLFTVGAASQTGKGLRYNIINTKSENGLGEVIEKNNLLETQAFEKITAVRHCNNKDIWIVIRKWNSDEYHAFLLKSTGLITTPIISHTNYFVGGSADNSIGSLKFSSNGKKLISVHSYNNNTLELIDFDNRTGVLSNQILFRAVPLGTPNNYTGVYATEFSPNNQLLYVTDNSSTDGENKLYQFNITSHNTATIEASKIVIASPDPNFSGGLQLANDGKIYVALGGESYLSVIENPDLLGTACNFIQKKFFVGQVNVAPIRFGLPNFLQSYFNPTSNPFTYSVAPRNCTNKSVSFTLNKTFNLDSVKWDFGDGNTSTQINPTHTYIDSGYYTVKLMAYYKACGQNTTDIFTSNVYVAKNNKLFGNDIGACLFKDKEITPLLNIYGATYLWNTNETTKSIKVNSFGKYWVDMTINECTLYDTILLYSIPPPKVTLGADTPVCIQKPIMLNAGNLVNAQYNWSTGDTTSRIFVNKPGVYFVKVTTDCEASDTVNVFTGDCGFFIPNAFTPNGNSVNDKFGVATTFGAKDFHFVIYDRWGNAIFKTNDNTQKWDGTFKGKAMPMGSYLWRITYTTLKGISKIEQGTVMLIR